MADVLCEIEEGHAFPHVLRNLVLQRDQVIDFYRWILEEGALDTRIHMTDWSTERVTAAIENWQQANPEARCRLDVRFKRPDDAVFVRMKFS